MKSAMPIIVSFKNKVEEKQVLVYVLINNYFGRKNEHY